VARRLVASEPYVVVVAPSPPALPPPRFDAAAVRGATRLCVLLRCRVMCPAPSRVPLAAAM